MEWCGRFWLVEFSPGRRSSLCARRGVSGARGLASVGERLPGVPSRAEALIEAGGHSAGARGAGAHSTGGHGKVGHGASVSLDRAVLRSELGTVAMGRTRTEMERLVRIARSEVQCRRGAPRRRDAVVVPLSAVAIRRCLVRRSPRRPHAGRGCRQRTGHAGSAGGNGSGRRGVDQAARGSSGRVPSPRGPSAGTDLDLRSTGGGRTTREATRRIAGDAP